MLPDEGEDSEDFLLHSLHISSSPEEESPKRTEIEDGASESPLEQNKETTNTASPLDTLWISEDVGPGCGGRVWEAAHVLSSYLDHVFSASCDSPSQNTLLLNGAPLRVLELGAGTGVVGIYAAKLLRPQHRLAQMTLTDLPILCPLMEENVRRNGLPADVVQVVPLAWGRDHPVPCAVQLPLDLILVSDCVYLESCFELLLDTLDVLLCQSAGGTETQCWMSYKRRRRAEKMFFIQLRKRFHVREVSPTSECIWDWLELLSRSRKILGTRNIRENVSICIVLPGNQFLSSNKVVDQ